ncbi:MAG: DUF167 domain-containing protein [Rhodospirillales bacterium]|nr:DUF167 domain-containing protein [Rhodospirillales bacterium]
MLHSPSRDGDIACPAFAVIGRRGLTVRLKVTPGARDDRIDGLIEAGDGSTRLKVSITAPADRGRANAAVLALLARVWELPKRSLTVAAGLTSRRKVIAVSGDTQHLLQRLTARTSSVRGRA